MSLKPYCLIVALLLTSLGVLNVDAYGQATTESEVAPPPPTEDAAVVVDEPSLQPLVETHQGRACDADGTTNCFDECFCGHAPWLAYGEFQAAPGDNESLIDGTAFVPLWQDHTTLLFANIRGQADDVEQYEGNWAAGLRSIQDDCWILGAFASFDRRWTNNSNEFNQATIGLEALAVAWEARANGYIPEDGAKPIGPRRPVVPGVVSQPVEIAYYGFDFEAGALLRSWGCDDEFELRGFVGGFHFDNDRQFPNISGPRARVELRIYDLDFLGEQSRITLGAHYQWDQVRDDQVHAMLRVRIPLGPGSNRGRLTPLERRMTDRIVRDVDIVVNNGTQTIGAPLPPPIPPAPPSDDDDPEETVPE